MPKQSTSEDEYFAREEAEKLKRLAQKQAEQIQKTERERLKTLHWMRCPKCGLEMQAILYKGVTIDKCFCCSGVFLDDGELEKIAGKESSFVQSVVSLFK